MVGSGREVSRLAGRDGLPWLDLTREKPWRFLDDFRCIPIGSRAVGLFLGWHFLIVAPDQFVGRGIEPQKTIGPSLRRHRNVSCTGITTTRHASRVSRAGPSTSAFGYILHHEMCYFTMYVAVFTFKPRFFQLQGFLNKGTDCTGTRFRRETIVSCGSVLAICNLCWIGSEKNKWKK